jgi:branched-chain amino acid transport system ATP-binding protein
VSNVESILQTCGLTRRFGGLIAVDAVDLAVRPGRIHCLIGPNGAGKSTLFNLISGVLSPSAGRVLFRDRDITGQPPHAISQLGLARSFQMPRLFPSLRLIDHLLLCTRERPTHAPRAERALERVGLAARATAPAGELAHGEKKRLEIAMAVALEPVLVMLDEPTAGMNAHETAEVADLVREVSHEVTVLLIEHDIDFVRQLADFVTVLHRGAILREGSLAEIEQDPEVRRIYLGDG